MVVATVVGFLQLLLAWLANTRWSNITVQYAGCGSSKQHNNRRCQGSWVKDVLCIVKPPQHFSKDCFEVSRRFGMLANLMARLGNVRYHGFV